MSCNVSRATPAVTPDGTSDCADNWEIPSWSKLSSLMNFRWVMYDGSIGGGVMTTGSPAPGWYGTTLPTRASMVFTSESLAENSAVFGMRMVFAGDSMSASRYRRKVSSMRRWLLRVFDMMLLE